MMLIQVHGWYGANLNTRSVMLIQVHGWYDANPRIGCGQIFRRQYTELQKGNEV